MGVTTVVVGMPGAEGYLETLQNLAQAGGWSPVPVSDPTGYEPVVAADGVEGLAATLGGVAAGMHPGCSFPVDLTEVVGASSYLSVAVDCEVVQRADPDPPADGDYWFLAGYAEPYTIYVEGPICDRILSEGVEHIDVDLLLACAHAPL